MDILEDSSQTETKNIAESQLKGNTLRVYLYIVSHKKSGVREVQRALHFSSSSLAQYHINKLVELQLISVSGGEYFLKDQIHVDVLKDFLKLGSVIIPRLVSYAVFFTILTTFLGVFVVVVQPLPLNMLFESLLGLASSFFWYEALRAWIKGPS